MRKFFRPITSFLTAILLINGCGVVKTDAAQPTAKVVQTKSPLDENFETVKLTDKKIPQGWKFRRIKGSSTSAELAKRADGGIYLKLNPHAEENFSGASTGTNIAIKDKPISVSFDFFLNGAENDELQRMRAGIFSSKDSSTTDNSIILEFRRNTDGGFGVYEVGSKASNRGEVIPLLQSDKTQYVISEESCGVWHKAELICYPDGNGGIKQVRYVIDGIDLISKNSTPTYAQPSDKTLGDFAYYAQCGTDESVWFGLDNISVSRYIGEIDEASVTFGDGALYKNMSEPWINKDYTKEKDCIKICGLNDAYVYFKPDYKLGNSSDGSVFDLKIDYSDKGGEGYFVVWYDTLDYGPQIAATEILKGDGKDKTVSVTLNDAGFAKGIDSKGDIMISLCETGKAGSGKTKYSASPCYLKSLSVTKRNEKNPVRVESVVQSDGNTFSYFEASKPIENVFCNTTDLPVEALVTYKLADFDNNVVFTKNESISIEGGGKLTRTVDISGVKTCGLYKWLIDISVGGKTYSFTEDTVAIVKTDKDGVRSDFAWINFHIERYGDEQKRTGIEMINKANMGGVRFQLHKSGLMNGDGSLKKADFTDTEYARLLSMYNKAKIPFWILLLDNTVPTGAEELAKWKAYCKYVMENTYGSTKIYEVWNEPDIESFNPTGATPKDIAEITKLAKAAALETEAEAAEIGEDVKLKVGGLSVTSLESSNRRNYWLKEALEAGIANGETGMDMLNVHTYAYEAAPERKKIYNILKEYRKDIKASGGEENIPILISEYGYTTADNGISDEKKAAMIVRSALLYKANGVGDMSSLYNLECKGVIDTYREDNFGLISCLEERYDIEGKYGIPNESYLAYAAMCDILGGSIASAEVVRAEDNVNLTKFVSDKQESEVYAVWTTGDSAEVTIDLGKKRAIVSDMYGNEKSIYSDDGKFKVSVAQNVTYIWGSTKPQVIDQNGDATEILDSAVSSAALRFECSADLKGVSVVSAAYDNDGVLKEVYVEKCNAEVGEEFVSKHLKIDKDCGSIKFFVWDMDDVIPKKSVIERYNHQLKM